MKSEKHKADIIVIGGGHAGIEAALVCSRLGMEVFLFTINLDTIGYMSCNPAIGGLAKGQLVRELDALGGAMGKAIDETGIQFKTLNVSRGVAVQSSRAQADKKEYNLYMKHIVENQDRLYVKQAKVIDILVDNNKAVGVKTKEQGEFLCKTVIVTPGTFLNGLIHIGFNHFPGGRIGEEASCELAEKLKQLGFDLGRFKTGTCARLDANTINFDDLKKQEGDKKINPFSLSNPKLDKNQIPCYVTYTNKKTHKIIKDNLDKSPLYTGVITGKGVRYCPSIEDKIVKFPDRERHHIFLEPEGRDTVEIYPNGISTSLPIEVQEDMISTIKGLEDARIMRPGYGIEHDFVQPTQLYPTLETKLIEDMFFAGQINGTTGYEEAAVQGFIAGVNACHKICKKPRFVMDRTQSYIGVLIDDLVTKGVDEPYRMFTSRAEYRLLLREDNVDLRLRELGHNIGLISKDEISKVRKKKKNIEILKEKLTETVVCPNREINKKLKDWNTTVLKKNVTAEKLLKRPNISYEKLMDVLNNNVGDFSENVTGQVEIQIKYQGYIDRQKKEVNKFYKFERIKIPEDLNYESISGISLEIIEKLKRVQPDSLGQALRIPGITPAAVSILNAVINKKHKKQK